MVPSISEIEEGFSGFATVGHIVHLNLREQLLPYRWVIGRILLDKVYAARYCLLFSCDVFSWFISTAISGQW
jgi:tRNA G37 N-methylase Trm5